MQHMVRSPHFRWRSRLSDLSQSRRWVRSPLFSFSLSRPRSGHRSCGHPHESIPSVGSPRHAVVRLHYSKAVFTPVRHLLSKISMEQLCRVILHVRTKLWVCSCRLCPWSCGNNIPFHTSVLMILPRAETELKFPPTSIWFRCGSNMAHYIYRIPRRKKDRQRNTCIYTNLDTFSTPS